MLVVSATCASKIKQRALCEVLAVLYVLLKV